MPYDPLRPRHHLTIDFVSSAAGSRKTLIAIQQSLATAKRGARTIIAMPTLELIREMSDFAVKHDPSVKVYVITHQATTSVEKAILDHQKNMAEAEGHLLFVTHAGLLRLTVGMPEQKQFHLIIDEELPVVLNQKPFQLRDSFYVVNNFFQTYAVTFSRQRDPAAPTEFTDAPLFRSPNDPIGRHYDSYTLASALRIRDDPASPPGAAASARRAVQRLEAKRDAWQAWSKAQGGQTTEDYYQLTAQQEEWLAYRIHEAPRDMVYQLFGDVPIWLKQDHPLFTLRAPWDAMTADKDSPAYKGRSGTINIIGIRRPDALRNYKSVTIMSALFEHTMCYAAWSRLGVTFRRSETIKVAQPVVRLGKRKLKIYYLTDQGWSLYARDRSGGIAKVFDLIHDAKVIDLDKPVCVVTNVSDRNDPAVDGKLRGLFPRMIWLPNDARGLNEYLHHHQLIHTAALNSYTADIRWLEEALGIDSLQQRIGRTGQAIYQSLMRLSLRQPDATDDVILVVMDRDVAEWLVQHFTPDTQVEVAEIDSSGVLYRRQKTGRKPIGDRAKTGAERQAEYLARRARKAAD